MQINKMIIVILTSSKNNDNSIETCDKDEKIE